MTAACMLLLHQAQRPIWPWCGAANGSIIEAFPAAQLYVWGLPHQGYNGASSSARAYRGRILTDLETRVDLDRHRNTLEGNADALDAVLCAFSARAVTEKALSVEPLTTTSPEGWIAVHR